MRRVGGGDDPGARRRAGSETGGQDPATPPGKRSAGHRFPAYLVLLGWHGLVVLGYAVLLVGLPGVGENDDNSPREDLLIFGATVGAPMLLGTLLVGLILLLILTRSRISSALVLGTVAATPMLLAVAMFAGVLFR